MQAGYGVSAQNLIECGWKAARNTGEDPDYLSMGFAFQRASEEATAAGRNTDARALKLFAAALSMTLRPESTNTPFGPSFTDGGKPSAMREPFDKPDLDALAGALPEIDDPWIRARFADIVWFFSTPRDIASARIARDAYVAIPLGPTAAYDSSAECWARAIALCLQIGSSERERLKHIEDTLIAKARAAHPESGTFLLRLAKLLNDGRMGRDHAAEIAKLLCTFADGRKVGGEFLLARLYYKSASEWFSHVKDETQSVVCQCAVAETFVSEAESRIASDPRGHMVAARFYEQAIQAYRRVPRSRRAENSVEERISEIYQSLKHAGQQSVNEMISIHSGPVDVRKITEAAISCVQGKSLGDAIYAFSMIYTDAGRQAHFQKAEEFFRSNFLQAMAEVIYLSPDGRVVARRPAVTFNNDDPAKYQLALQDEAVKSFAFNLTFAVEAQLRPAFDKLVSEHRFVAADLIELAQNSPLVPPNRETLVGKALFFGFEGDFETALHLGIPQIEHLVRWHLNGRGVKTATLNKDGTEMENGLSTLTELQQFPEVFGEDLAFEIRALFCDQYGPNLRNELAHGLLASSEANGVQSFYAWWLLLKLVFSHFVIAHRAA